MPNDESGQTVTVKKQTGKIVDVKDPEARNRSLTPQDLEDFYKKQDGLELVGVILYGHSSPG